jgi:hypothetical protein
VLERHRFGELVEPLKDRPSFVSRAMFGCVACYLEGRLVLVLADRREPWRGVLVPTSREMHAALLKELPDLGVHPVLRKWLYLPETSGRFTETARRIVELSLSGDPRIGIEPKFRGMLRRDRPRRK